MKLFGYRLSKDQIGLLKDLPGGGWFHIHSDELTIFEKIIHFKLILLDKLCPHLKLKQKKNHKE